MNELRFASEEEALLYLAQKTGAVISVCRTASEAAKQSLVESAKTLVREDVLPRVKRSLLEYLGEGLAYERYIQPIEDTITETHIRGIVNDIMLGLNKAGVNPNAEDKKEFIYPYFKWLAFSNGAYDGHMRRNLERAVLKTVEKLQEAGHDVSPSHVEDTLVQWFSRRALEELPRWRKLDKPTSFDEMLNLVFRDLDETDFRNILNEVSVDNVGYEDIKQTTKNRNRPDPKKRQEVQRRLNLPEFRNEFKSISSSLRAAYRVMDGRILTDKQKKTIALWYRRAKSNRDRELAGMFGDFMKRVEEVLPKIAQNYESYIQG
jgi:hypothetical protein